MPEAEARCAIFLFAGPDDCWPDRCQPIIQRVAGHGSPPAESRTRIGPIGRHDNVGPDASLAIRERPLPVRAFALGRSRVDTWCRQFLCLLSLRS